MMCSWVKNMLICVIIIPGCRFTKQSIFKPMQAKEILYLILYKSVKMFTLETWLLPYKRPSDVGMFPKAQKIQTPIYRA